MVRQTSTGVQTSAAPFINAEMDSLPAMRNAMTGTESEKTDARCTASTSSQAGFALWQENPVSRKPAETES